ncbi:uncharacterized protein LOC111462577 isoform X1 [Cucurbita moschata]|uniref:Uncharacterized protein LOC111462577 isoform X1 n=1 Tax=Cucurbita moschata TaxID=3662 RepID=A0A6J1HDC5_CUCMO|nr:uncharacterized protein LOC111462577 isoform X1 [Cucurbita moschata]
MAAFGKGAQNDARVELPNKLFQFCVEQPELHREFFMGKRFLLGMLIVTLTVIVCGAVEGGSLSKQKSMRMNSLRKQAIKSIRSEDGDIIDCVSIYDQPAFDHPALRNHTIQLAPTYDPTIDEHSKKATAEREGKEEKNSMVVKQTWRKSGSCPEGTIPIRRIRKHVLLKAKSIERYGRKKPMFSQENAQLPITRSSHTLLTNRSKAFLLTAGNNYNAAKGDIKVCNPRVEFDDEYSTSQVALLTGPYYNFEAIESGWAVNPGVYGDRQTRLFVYWTADASEKTGCFDLTCPGFVQTSNEIALGSAIYPISTPNGLPYEIIMFLFRDFKTDNWWVQYGESINIGYWPPELFSALSHTAETVQWGGEVYSTNIGRPPHTRTAMGSGRFPDFISGTSGWVKRMRVRDNSMVLMFPGWVEHYSDEYDCYDVDFIRDYLDDPELYYGGPGKNPRCP